MPLSFIFSFFPELNAIQVDLILNLSLLFPEECSGGYNLRKHLLAIMLVDRSKIIRNPAATFVCKDNFHVTVIKFIQQSKWALNLFLIINKIMHFCVKFHFNLSSNECTYNVT